MLTCMYLIKTLTGLSHSVNTYNPFHILFYVLSQSISLCVFLIYTSDISEVWLMYECPSCLTDLLSVTAIFIFQNFCDLSKLWVLNFLADCWVIAIRIITTTTKKRLLNTLPDWHSVYTALYLYNELLERRRWRHFSWNLIPSLHFFEKSDVIRLNYNNW